MSAYDLNNAGFSRACKKNSILEKRIFTKWSSSRNNSAYDLNEVGGMKLKYKKGTYPGSAYDLMNIALRRKYGEG